MDHNRVDAHILEEHHVLGEASLELLVDHGPSTVFYDEGLPVKAPNIGERLHQDLSLANKIFHQSCLSYEGSS